MRPMVSRKMREGVYERDGYRCTRCGDIRPLSIHHRINRGMGGSKLRDHPACLLTLCVFCNSLLESSPTAAGTARARGWKLRSHQDPLAVPVYDPYDGTWYLLTDDYERVRTDPPGRDIA